MKEGDGRLTRLSVLPTAGPQGGLQVLIQQGPPTPEPHPSPGLRVDRGMRKAFFYGRLSSGGARLRPWVPFSPCQCRSQLSEPGERRASTWGRCWVFCDRLPEVCGMHATQLSRSESEHDSSLTSSLREGGEVVRSHAGEGSA